MNLDTTNADLIQVVGHDLNIKFIWPRFNSMSIPLLWQYENEGFRAVLVTVKEIICLMLEQGILAAKV